MLFTNRLNFFDKAGLNFNPSKTQAIIVSVVQAEGGVGFGAQISAFANLSGVIDYVEIQTTGVDYNPLSTYLSFFNIANGLVWNTQPSDLSFGGNGEIIGFTIPSSPENGNFIYPSEYYLNQKYLEPVSTGLITTDHIFILEEVLNSNGGLEYVLPRIEEYGPYPVVEYSANGTSASLKIETISIAGTIYAGNKNTLAAINPSVLAQLTVGMFVLGPGITQGTQIRSIDTKYNLITLSEDSVVTGSVVLTAYTPHNIRTGNTIRIFDTITTTPLDGEHTVTLTTPTHIFFTTTVNISATTTSTLRYSVIPIFEVAFESGSDPEYFLFDINYNEDYPSIVKQSVVYFTLSNASLAAIPDLIPTTGNGKYIRTVYGRLEKEALQLNIGLQADYEGVYTATMTISDITFPTKRTLLTNLYDGEVVAEDERLGLLLENFGRDVTEEQELILRDSDVNEALPDWLLLNKKRKEMLLQGEDIWPYVGSYKGLVNIINWFGYFDIRIKEYWLNVNQEDEYFGKYRQMQVPFQLKDKGKNSDAITLLPSKHYRKTNLFGLYYDIVRDNGDFDNFGIPETEDAFAYTNEEVLIKLFALKRYLREKFLPLNTRIVDITGEGVYYERYAVNSWNDQSSELTIDLTRQIDFKVDTRRQPIIDIRPFDASANLISPPYYDPINKYTARYDILRAYITNPGGAYFGVIPSVSFLGQAEQAARGIVKVKASAIGILSPMSFTGVGYQSGDIITLAGGAYDNPIRITVNLVGLNGEVQNFGIISGTNQGNNYTALPPTFYQANVLRPVGGQYVTPNATGFTVAASDIPFEAESISLYDLGLKYGTLPTVVFTPNIGGVTAELETRTYPGNPVIYFNDGARLEPYIDAPNIAVGAPINLSTNFDITWDEVPYRWIDLGGGSDAVLKGWVDPLPSGSGQLLAIEILSPGSGYRYAPTLTVSGGDGFGASGLSELLGGELKILEFTVSAVSNSLGTGDLLTLSPALPLGGLGAISANKIVLGAGIPVGTIINLVNQPFSEITLTDISGNPITTTINPGDTIQIHQGVAVATNGVNYTTAPNIAVNGGHVGTLYTWDELGRGDFYQMEWRVTLSEPENPTNIFNYQSGIGTIDSLINTTVFVPYTGKYTLELVVYDTDNNFINEIKTNWVEVFLPEATFAHAARYNTNCIATWNDTFQEPLPEFEPSRTQLAPTPFEGIRYDWNSATGRWVNPVFNDTNWEDAQVNWETLELGNLSAVNEYHFPPTIDFEIVQVSAEDNTEGPILWYRDPNTTPSSPVPRIRILNQRAYPQIEPTINPNDWIFIRRSGVIYQLEVLASDYTVPGFTTIDLVNTPPSAFRNSAPTWSVLREIAGTVAVSGNRIYDPITNPTGIKAGEWIRVFGSDDTPKRRRIPISGKDNYVSDPNYITLPSVGSDNIYYKGGEISQIYKYRGSGISNGNLVWNSNSSLSTWVIEPSSSTDPLINDHIGKLYIVDNDPTGVLGIGCQPANPVSEIRPGFSTLQLFVELNGALVYNQRLRSTHAYLDSSTSGHPYDIWSSVTAGAVTTFTWSTVAAGLFPANFGYIGVPTTTTGGGSSATFNVSVSGGLVTSFSLSSGGVDYLVGDTLTIDGALIGGTTGVDDIIITVSTITPLSSVNGIYVIDLVTLDGGSLSGLNTELLNWYAQGAIIWLEYEYEIFPVRTYLGSNQSGNAEIYMDFNMYPASGSFISAPSGDFTLSDTGWFYDHGIVSGDYTIYVTNVGTWRNGLGTLITVDDTNFELYRTTTSYRLGQRSFDEDFAENRLGTLVQTWENYRSSTWVESCSHTWDSLDLQERLMCNFQITLVDQNGGIQFNNDPQFLFQGIVGGMNEAEKWSQALYELKETDNPGLSRFDYFISSGSTGSGYLYGKIDTYNFPNQIYDVATPTFPVAASDVLVADWFDSAATINTVALPIITMNNPLPKKITFTGDIQNGNIYIQNIQGLLAQDIYVGEIITGLGLPSAPSAPATVLELFISGGHVRQIKLSIAPTVTSVNSTFSIEWWSQNQLLPHFWMANDGAFRLGAWAKTPSIDQLGWLIGQNNVEFQDPLHPISSSIGHTYPLKNTASQFGYGIGKVGGFLNGVSDYLIWNRFYQIYQYNGINPLSLPGGWYPAAQIPPLYQFTPNPPSPTPPNFDNVSVAEIDANRLPYESGLGGAMRWEDTNIGIYPTKIPTGSVVLLSADASQIAGKTQYLWKVSNQGKILVETTDPNILWTLSTTGFYTIELEITDSNGNQKRTKKEDFIEAYE